MNKLILAAAVALLVGMAGAATSTQEVQLQQAQIFQNEDTRLNSVYAMDQQGNFYGFIFREDGAYLFGTVDTLDALEGEIEVCQHYLVRRGGLLQQDMTISEVNCSPLQESRLGGEMPPTVNQTNQTSG